MNHKWRFLVRQVGRAAVCYKMADISYLQNEDLEDSEEAVEDEEDEDKEGKEGKEREEDKEGKEDEINGKSGDDDMCGLAMMPFEDLLQNTAHTTTLNRQMVGRLLLETFKGAEEAECKLDFDEIFDAVYQIIKDPDPSIRLDLIEQLSHVAIICEETPELFENIISRHILGIVLKHLRDSDNQVRQAAQSALIAIANQNILTDKQLEFQVCPVILNMTYMQIEFINTAIVLISKLGPYMRCDLLEDILLDRYLTLCNDEKFYVRKVCATYLGELCAIVEEETIYKKLLPKYINLCIDEIWGVRKACVDVMLSVASCVHIHKYRLVLAKLLATHLNDESKWVQSSAYQILGPFITIFSRQFCGLKCDQYGDYIMYRGGGLKLKQSVIPYTKSVLEMGPNDMFATPLEKEIGILGIDVYAICRRKVPSDLNTSPGKKKKNDSSLFAVSNWLGEITESEEQTDGTSETSEEDINKFNPFQYYYIPPEMPLDLELVYPSDKSSSKEKEETFDEVFDKIFSDTSKNKRDLGILNLSEDAICARKKINNKKRCISLQDESKLSKVDSQSMNDTVDVGNLSFNFETYEFNVPMDTAGEESTDGSVPQFLIDYFVSMVDPSPLADTGTEIHHQCAFCFPAVVMTLGRKNWHQLKNAYQVLAGAMQWKVRCTLASSIHEVALILGEELAGSDLVPIYDGFIKDLDEVRIGALKHLSTFLKVLKPVDREQYLPKLSNFVVTDTEWNWRFREEFANQLIDVVPLYKPEQVSEHIAPLALHLLKDKVAAVRHVARSLISSLSSYFVTEEALATALVQEVRDDLLKLTKWTCRQTYILVCSRLIRNQSISGNIFAKELLPSLLDLSNDKVPNVRLAVARILAWLREDYVIPLVQNWLSDEQTEAVIEKLKQLQQDPDRDVRVLAGGCEVNEAGDQNFRHTFLLDAF